MKFMCSMNIISVFLVSLSYWSGAKLQFTYMIVEQLPFLFALFMELVIVGFIRRKKFKSRSSLSPTEHIKWLLQFAFELDLNHPSIWASYWTNFRLICNYLRIARNCGQKSKSTTRASYDKQQKQPKRQMNERLMNQQTQKYYIFAWSLSVID